MLFQQKSIEGGFECFKLAGVAFTAAGLAIFLLWLLFSGGESEKVLPGPYVPSLFGRVRGLWVQQAITVGVRKSCALDKAVEMFIV